MKKVYHYVKKPDKSEAKNLQDSIFLSIITMTCISVKHRTSICLYTDQLFNDVNYASRHAVQGHVKPQGL